MTEETRKNLELRSEITELGYAINGDIDHGECFYELDMLNDFCKSLYRMKELALEYYNSNKKEMEK